MSKGGNPLDCKLQFSNNQNFKQNQNKRGVYMNKKFRNILSLGAITMLTASSMLPVNALSKTCYNKVMTIKSVYIYM